jgi:hypothetical protein
MSPLRGFGSDAHERTHSLRCYTAEDSVVNRSLLSKAYVRAAFGSDSQLFKQIKGLVFKSNKR